MDELVALCKEEDLFINLVIFMVAFKVFMILVHWVELKNNIKKAWWDSMIYQNDDIEGLDSAILTNPLVLKYSGHEDTFSDPMVDL